MEVQDAGADGGADGRCRCRWRCRWRSRRQAQAQARTQIPPQTQVPRQAIRHWLQRAKRDDCFPALAMTLQPLAHPSHANRSDLEALATPKPWAEPGRGRWPPHRCPRADAAPIHRGVPAGPRRLRRPQREPRAPARAPAGFRRCRRARLAFIGDTIRVTGVGVSTEETGSLSAKRQPCSSDAVNPASRNAVDAISINLRCGRCAGAWPSCASNSRSISARASAGRRPVHPPAAQVPGRGR